MGNLVNKEDMIDTKREILQKSLQEITLDSNKENCYNNTKKVTPIARCGIALQDSAATRNFTGRIF